MRRTLAWQAKLLALFLIVTIALAVHYDCDCATQQQAQDDPNKMHGWLCRFLNDPNAVFTCLGVVAVIYGFVYLRNQLRQGDRANEISLNAAKQASMDAKEATEQTRRSVDAYIAAERGAVLFRVDKVENGRVVCALTNTGRSNAFVHDYMIKILPTDAVFQDGDSFPNDGTWEQFDKNIPPGESIKLWGLMGKKIPENLHTDDGHLLPFNVFFKITYDTMNIQAIERTAWQFGGGRIDNPGRAFRHPWPGMHGKA